MGNVCAHMQWQASCRVHRCDDTRESVGVRSVGRQWIAPRHAQIVPDALHNEPKTAERPVILMSAARPGDWQASGAVVCLTKPFAIAAIPRLIERHLAAR